MPTTSQKVDILRRAGVAVPPSPASMKAPATPAVTKAPETPAAPRGPATATSPSHDPWTQEVDRLFEAYVLARAARSLKEAEEAQQLAHQRHAAAQLGQHDPQPGR